MAYSRLRRLPVNCSVATAYPCGGELLRLVVQLALGPRPEPVQAALHLLGQLVGGPGAHRQQARARRRTWSSGMKAWRILTYCAGQYQILPMTVLEYRRPRLMVVVAHPDDETFGCGSLLLPRRGRRDGHRRLLCDPRATPASGPTASTLPAGGIAEQREGELYAAAERARGQPGRRPRASATRAWTAMRDRHSGRRRPGGRRRPRARGRRRLRPDVLVTLDASDGHRDHARIRDVTVAVAREARIPVYLYCLARRLMARWAEVMTERDPGSTTSPWASSAHRTRRSTWSSTRAPSTSGARRRSRCTGRRPRPSRGSRRTCAASGSRPSTSSARWKDADHVRRVYRVLGEIAVAGAR